MIKILRLMPSKPNSFDWKMMTMKKWNVSLRIMNHFVFVSTNLKLNAKSIQSLYIK